MTRLTRHMAIAATGLTALCGAAGCGGSGGSSSSSDSNAVKSTVTAMVKQHDCSTMTAAARKSLTGEASVARCSHDLGLRTPVHSLEFTAVSTAGDRATAKVNTDGHAVTLGLVRQDGTWLISDISG